VQVEITIGWVWVALCTPRLFLQERKAISDEASTRITIISANAD
jgi:hypothetical protein